MKKLVLAVAALLLVLVAVVAIRTATFHSPAFPGRVVGPAPVLEPLDGDVERFAGSLRFRTVSRDDPSTIDTAEFAAFRDHLVQSFPRVHESLERTAVGEHALLYVWPGRDPDLRPLVLLGHYDVVGVQEATAQQWRHPPFSGDVVDGWIWGRGALDNKVAVLGALEAVETLLARDARPERTVILAFGHDEEVGGEEGAARLAARLDSAGVVPELVVDEGGVIGDGLVAGVEERVALVGVAEKGYASIRLTAAGEGGHASMPPHQTAAGVIAAAVAALESEPMPAELTSTGRMMFDRLGPEMSGANRVILANLWLFEPLLLRMLATGAASNATIRTTIAPTRLEGSTKENVLPTQASAVLNVRILPGDSIADAVNHIRRVVDDERVEIEVVGAAYGPSPVAPSTGPEFARLAAAIAATDPEVLITPFLFVGFTDSRHYTPLTDRVYRFLPNRMTPELMAAVHGINERIRVEDYRRVVDFYARLIANGRERPEPSSQDG